MSDRQKFYRHLVSYRCHSERERGYGNFTLSTVDNSLRKNISILCRNTHYQP